MPITVVLDASFAMALFVPHPKAATVKAVLDQLNDAESVIIAPTLWLYEVTSSINKLAHFKEISADQAIEAVRLAEAFHIRFVVPDFSLARRAMAWSQRMQRASVYDSFYLALAEERGCD